MDPQPLVSIVTPTFNTARFLERTIESVLAQDYAAIEYIVMDGGSTDGTQAVLERFSGRLQYVSAPDGGTADAINQGFLKSRGSIFAWLNADDTYPPGAVRAEVCRLMAAPDVAVVYGEGLWTDENDAVLGRYPTVSPYDDTILERECFICQPAAFMRRTAFEENGMLNPSFHFAFDYDLWIRLSKVCRFLAVPEVLATSRMHSHNKSLAQRTPVFREAIRVVRLHYGYVPVHWIYGYLSFLRDGRDQYFEPLRHSIVTYLASLPAGMYYNYKHVRRYWQEWRSHVTIPNLLRVATDPEARMPWRGKSNSDSSEQ